VGEVKDAVHGTPPSKKSKKKKIFGKTDKEVKKALTVRMAELHDEVSLLVQKKDADTQSEGDTERAENMRKAGLLRASASMLASVKTLLEDY